MRASILSLLLIGKAWANPEVDALLGKLARPVPVVTAFVEVRFSDLMTTPLVSRGELAFDAADHMRKRVDQPFQETTSVQGEQVRVERAGRKPMKFNLKRAPELRAMLSGFSGLLQGDAQLLQSFFKLELKQNEVGWQLQLDPLSARIRDRVSRITVRGDAGGPRCFYTAQKDGDISILLVEAAAQLALPETLTEQAVLGLCGGVVES